MEETRRGYHIEDIHYFGMESSGVLRRAAEDVCYLLNRGYNIRQAVTFAGNHYLLAERQRSALVRSLASDIQLTARKRRELENGQLPGCIHIDGFNTIITLETALSGSMLLSCLDGTVRDLAGLHGTYRIIDKTEPAVRLVFRSLIKNGVSSAVVYLDKQVSNSGRLCSLVSEIAEKEHFRTQTKLIPDVDTQLICSGCVITSDSVILDRCGAWYNLNRRIIETSIADAWVVRLLDRNPSS
jgi:hypothetical protein